MSRKPVDSSHVAAVYRTEAQARRQAQPIFATLLDQWAINADRRAGLSEQPDLFGAIA